MNMKIIPDAIVIQTPHIAVGETFTGDHTNNLLFCTFIDCVFIDCTFATPVMCRFNNCTFKNCILHTFNLCDLKSCNLDSCNYGLGVLFQSCEVSELVVDNIAQTERFGYWRLAYRDPIFMSAFLGCIIEAPNYCWNDFAETLPLDVLQHIVRQLEPYVSEIDNVFASAYEIYKTRSQNEHV